MSPSSPLTPRTFYLNEAHELVHDRHEGGFSPPKLVEIDWAARSTQLDRTLRAAKAATSRTRDPSREHRYFLVARPANVEKRSNQKKYPTGVFTEKTDYAGEHSRVLGRLGLDLLTVDRDGVALVHATADRFDRLLSTAARLASEGPREKARWVAIDSFDPVPASFRVDQSWLSELEPSQLVDAVVEMQPLLSRAEIEDVLKAAASLLRRDVREAFTGAGLDFSGRVWYRARLSRPTIEALAREFASLQSIHPPLYAKVAAEPTRGQRASPAHTAQPQLVLDSPVVAIVDVGVPDGHVWLQPARRGSYRLPDAGEPYYGDHGSRVASRAVFGDVDYDPRTPLPAARCRFLDVMVATDTARIDKKVVLPALDAVVGAYPDVRVFNLSFGDDCPIAAYPQVEQRERLALTRDLDNFVFARDAIVVVAAGNLKGGFRPNKPYPEHVNEPDCAIGAWPSGFNTLTCGSMVNRVHPDGLAKGVGYPSPCSRVGPGMADAPIPEFGAAGGNSTEDWTWRAGLGVWSSCADGRWEDSTGTSFAAPLLAREAAIALKQLEHVCPPGTRPFAAAVKAFLTLTATREPGLPRGVKALADRTIGAGRASADRLTKPKPESAVLLWQGVLQDAKDIARVEIPVPRVWWKAATAPRLELVCTWFPPVNDAASAKWATRRVDAHLHVVPTSRARAASGRGHATYPLIRRVYDLKQMSDEHGEPAEPPDDNWLLTLQYKEIAQYYVGIDFSPQQRVAVAVELSDAGESPVSPQEELQKLPAAATMVRLSSLATALVTPIAIKRR